MASIQIPNLPAVIGLDGSELFEGVQAGTSVKISLNQIASAVLDVSSTDQITYNEGDTGAVTRVLTARLQDYVSVKDFGAVGNGIANDTAAIQAAINSGKPIVFPAGIYASGPLTQSANFQRFYANGQVTIAKNANGVLFTSTGIYVELSGIQFVGTGYTGDNINMSGNNPRLINCSSYGTPGRALKATGGHVQIIETSGTYSTTDSTASGYDIEIGVSGTATLYHQLIGVYTSQATGGILLIDTGSHVISGGQFGKLAIKSGTSPAGVNGGMTNNARILGDVTVEASNAVFTGNQFSTQTITFAAGTSGNSLDSSNLTASTTIVNNGNGNSSIIKSIGTGAPISGIVLQYGSDANNATVIYAQDEIYLADSSLNLANNKSLKFADSTGVYYGAVSLSTNDDWFFGANNGANFSIVSSGSGGVYHGVSGASITQTTSSAFRPVPDGTINLGGASNRWNTVYATTVTASTSVLSTGAGGIGYATGAGVAVTQLTSRTTTTPTTGAKTTGAVTLFTTTAVVGTYFSFTVPNTAIAVTDTVVLSVRGATNTYVAFVSAITAATSFQVTMASVVGTASDTPIVNFTIIKGVSA